MTARTTHQSTTRWLLAAVIVSLVVHAVLLALPGWTPTPPEQSPGLEVSLLTLPPEAPEPLPPEPEVTPETVINESVQSVLTQADPAVPEDSPDQRVDEAPSQPESLVAIETAESEADIETVLLPFGEQVLAAVRDNIGPIEPPARDSSLAPASIPALPDPPGWINDYVGTVQPEIDRWMGNDGSRHARIVTASGKVYCGRADPPTQAEMFNPSMATNVMTFHRCGRERPPPVDRDDPWLRAPSP